MIFIHFYSISIALVVKHIFTNKVPAVYTKCVMNFLSQANTILLSNYIYSHNHRKTQKICKTNLDLMTEVVNKSTEDRRARCSTVFQWKHYANLLTYPKSIKTLTENQKP